MAVVTTAPVEDPPPWSSIPRGRHGILAYWVVDPDPGQPSLRAWELQDGRFVEMAYVRHDERFSTKTPFPVAMIASELVGR